MKKSVKALLLVMCAIVLVVATVFTTLAFLQDNTDTITNTFSVGAVGIKLTETEVNNFGAPVNGTTQRVDSGSQPYKLVPGNTITKDPTVTVDVASETSYVFVKVDMTLTGFLANNYFTIADGWTQLKNGEDDVVGVYYREYVASDATVNGPDGSAVAASYPVFAASTYEIPTGLSSTELNQAAGSEIAITGYAIQVEGFEGDFYGAWTEVYSQAQGA